ncbi:MAG: extracellular solute-binding protein, partial [Chloroflexota bacterium]
MVFGDPAEYNAYRELAAAFNESQDTVQVELTHVPSPTEYRTRLVTEFAAGSPGDITLMNYRRYAGFAANDMLTPLGPYLEKSDLISLEDFYPAATEAF